MSDASLDSDFVRSGPGIILGGPVEMAFPSVYQHSLDLEQEDFLMPDMSYVPEI